LVQAVGLFGKTSGVVEADPPLPLDGGGRDECFGGDGLQILFKTVVADPIPLAGVMKVIHVDQDITFVAGGAFLEPKIQTAGGVVTFWSGHSLASLFNLITTRQRMQAKAADDLTLTDGLVRVRGWEWAFGRVGSILEQSRPSIWPSAYSGRTEHLLSSYLPPIRGCSETKDISSVFESSPSNLNVPVLGQMDCKNIKGGVE
jgi:hypothetical protein